MDAKFSKARKGYNRDEVDAFVKSSGDVNAAQRLRIDELTKKLNESESQLSALRQKQDLIVSSIMGAMQKAEQIEDLTKQKYEFDMAQLRSFHERWNDYYNKLIAKFPLDGQLRGLNNFNRNMTRLLNGAEKLDSKLMGEVDGEISQAKAQFLRESARLEKKPEQPESDDTSAVEGIPIFNPEETIRGLIRRQLEEEAGKKRRKQKDKKDDSDEGEQLIEEGGFSYEEALNPKQELGEILKELGLDLD